MELAIWQQALSCIKELHVFSKFFMIVSFMAVLLKTTKLLVLCKILDK